MKEITRDSVKKNIESKVRLTKNRKISPLGKYFRSRLLPNSGNFCVVAFIDGQKTPEQHWYKSKLKAINSIKLFDKENTQVYLAMASYKASRLGRKQSNALFLKCYFLDIDCGTGKNGKPKPYATQTKGKEALLSFCKTTGLPIPAIVNSGNGLYAYWILTEEVPADKWIQVANRFKKLVHAIEEGLDNDGIIADSARILRPIHSTHRKDPNNPRKVRLLQDGDPISFKTFEQIIEDALKELQDNQTSTTTDATNQVYQDGNRPSAILIAEKCAVIKQIMDKKGNVGEPEWYAFIGLAKYCVEAPNIIHECSSGHPNYNTTETNNKIEQYVFPPTTCERFSLYFPKLCCNCVFKDRINSPIALGCKSQVPEYVEELNKKHFIATVGGKTLVCQIEKDIKLNRDTITYSKFSDFRNRYNNKRASVGTDKNGNHTYMPLGNAWLDHPLRRQFEGITMAPGETIDGYFNLWQGFSYSPQKGSWELMRKHIRYVICNGNKNQYMYVKRWMARMIQYPGKLGEVALVIQGDKGTGKGKFVNKLCQLLGQHSCSVRSSRHFTGNFNAHLEDCVLLYVDEAFWAGDKAAESVLKGMITEPTLLIESKGIDAKEARNMLHIILTSNSDWVVPASSDERRYCILKASNKHKEDYDYFAAIDAEMDNGGFEAMLYELLHLDISDFNVRDFPKTEGLTEQKLQSLDPVPAWWYAKLCNGELLPGDGWAPVQCSLLYDDYVVSSKKQGNAWRGGESAFGKQLNKLLPENWPKKNRPGKNSFGKRPQQYNFPTLKECREYFERYLRVDSLEW